MQTTLRDGSKLKQVHRVWSMDHFHLIEATTTYGQKVLCSRATEDRWIKEIGR